MQARASRWVSLAFCAFASGCSGVQSALAPAGEEAHEVARLFCVMVGAGGAIWLGVIGLLVYASHKQGRGFGERDAGRLIFWCGAALPSLLLFLLLGYALWLMPGLRPFAHAAGSSGLTIVVTGEQFWWRVVYHSEDSDRPVFAANEVRLPVGERVEFLLNSTDVIHSFWIPSLGGKMDMIPGRQTRLSLLATKPGTYRAACAEYCGTSHALMAFTAIAMEPEAFRQWLAARSAPSPGAGSAGRDLFLRNGCGACHRVDGTEANGDMGPDLSHVGSRATLGAGILPNDEEALRSFIAHPQSIKPGSKMPDFAMLPEQDIAGIAAWLKGLE
jgi:cytochrome c oxidase subunit 2